MKKLFFAIVAVAAISFAACGNNAANTEETDTVACDSACIEECVEEVVDSAIEEVADSAVEAVEEVAEEVAE